MYCKHCGMENDNSSAQCKICLRPLEAQTEDEKKKVYLDFTLFKYNALLKAVIKKFHILNLLSFPIISIIYFYYKLIRRPFWTPLYSNMFCQLKSVNLAALKIFITGNITNSEKELRDLGFIPLLTVQDITAAAPLYSSLYINRSSGAYAKLMINRLSGSIEYVSFMAMTSSQKFYEFTNTDGIGTLHNQIILKHFPQKNMKQLWEAFTLNLVKKHEQTLCMELYDLMPILYQARIRIIRIETAKGHLRCESPSVKTPLAWSCYKHPLSAAVRKCPTCGLTLCEACIVEYNDTYYCSKCVPWHTEKKDPKKPWGYAGVAVRTLAGIIDLALIIIVALLSFYFFRFIFSKTAIMHADLFAFMTMQIPFMLFIFWNSIYRVVKSGQSAGKRICGLHVIDKNGQKCVYISAINRFALKMCSLVFIFPLSGYLLIPFSKTKKCFIDKLSGTVVIAKYPFRKAVISCIVLAPVITAIMLFFSYVITDASLNLSQSYLKPCWEKKGQIYKIYPDFRFSGNEPHFLYCKDLSVLCVSKTSGNLIWQKKFSAKPQLQYNDAGYILAIEKAPLQNAHLVRLDKSSGRILWNTVLPDTSSKRWNIACDSSVIIAFHSDRIVTISNMGVIQWEKKLPSDSIHDKETINSGNKNNRRISNLQVQIDPVNNRILLNQMYNSMHGQSFSYDISTGDITTLSSFIDAAPVLINDSCYYEHLPGRHIGVFSRIDKHMIFRTPDTSKELYIKRFEKRTSANNSSLIYGSHCAYSTADGTMAFCYSDGYTLESITDHFLILSDTGFQTSSRTPQTAYSKRYRIVNRFSNIVFTDIKDSSISSLDYLSENDSLMYLNMITKAENAEPSISGLFSGKKKKLSGSAESTLLIVNKNNASIKRSRLGMNIYSVQIIKSGNKNLVFMYGSDFAGAYNLN